MSLPPTPKRYSWLINSPPRKRYKMETESTPVEVVKYAPRNRGYVRNKRWRFTRGYKRTFMTGRARRAQMKAYLPGGDSGARFRGPGMRIMQSGLPPILWMKLNYYDNYQMTLSGTPLYANLRLNNPTDPIVALGGHQPCPWDQMAGIYEHYVVAAAKVEYMVHAYKASNTDPDFPVDVGVRVQSINDGPAASFYNFIEQPDTYVFTAPTQLTSEPKRHRVYAKPWKILGYSNITEYNDDTDLQIPIQNTTYTIPNNKEAQLVFGVDPVPSGVCRLNIIIRITYYGFFKNLKTIDPSLLQLQRKLLERYLNEQKNIQNKINSMNLNSPVRH